MSKTALDSTLGGGFFGPFGKNIDQIPFRSSPELLCRSGVYKGRWSVSAFTIG